MQWSVGTRRNVNLPLPFQQRYTNSRIYLLYVIYGDVDRAVNTRRRDQL